MSDPNPDSIWKQLQEQDEEPTVLRPVPAEEPLNAENAEQFIYKNAQELITNAIQSMQSLKEIVQTNPSAEEAEAFARLVEASTSAIETVNKMVIANKRNATTIKVKEMDVESRQNTALVNAGTKIMLSREEVMKQLFDQAKEIQAESKVIEDKSS